MQGAADGAVDADEDRGGAVLAQGVGLLRQRVGCYALFREEPRIAQHDPAAVDRAERALRWGNRSR
jgi:hypothetical protein